MTVKEIAAVMGTQFIAVSLDGDIKYSGSANKFSGWTENHEVIEIKAAKGKSSATIIMI